MRDLQFTHADQLALERSLSEELSEFLQLAWHVIEPGTPYKHNWHMDAVCEHLEALAAGEINRLLINIPPGTSKSTAASVMFPAWLWGPNQQKYKKIIGAAHDLTLAIRDNRKNRLLVESQWYQERWPTPLVRDRNEKTGFENEERGFREACAVAHMTGRRGDVVIWDDPHSPEKAHSDAERERAIRVFTDTLPSRVNDPEKSAIMVIMQRLHQEDVSGYILEHDLGYTHLCLPMEFDSENRCRTSIGWSDPRKEEGELLFENRFPPAVIKRDKKAMTAYAWAGQMQQRPAPAGGGVIKEDWWSFWHELPSMKWRMIFADTAQKTGRHNDYSVLQCWGLGLDNKAVLVDQVRGKWESPQLLTIARLFWNKHKAYDAELYGYLRSMNVEDKVSGTTVVQTLRQEGIPVLPIQRNTDKLTRVENIASYIEAGLVSLPGNERWVKKDYIPEFSAFTPNMTHKHDDQMDPTVDAIDKILGGAGMGQIATAVPEVMDEED